MLKVKMKNKDVITPSDLQAAIRDTFKNHPLPVGRPPSLTIFLRTSDCVACGNR